MPKPQFRLAVLTNSVSRVNGGIFDAMRNLTIAIAAEGRYFPRVFSAEDSYTENDKPLWGNISTTTFPIRGPRIFGYAPQLAAAVGASNADILHVHGIWMYPSVVAFRWSRGTRPYLVSPHGLLKPRALHNSRWKKRIADLLYENEHLRHAACLHALNAAEAEALRGYGLANPICIIPNGTTQPDDPVIQRSQRDRSILYLGRFHPLKGLLTMLEAWCEVREDAAATGWRLTLAGWDQNHHRSELERFVDRHQLRSSVVFLGPQFDADKARSLAGASAFMLPSRSEGLPVSVLEAWSWQLPVLMTHECNLPDGAEAGAAIMMEPEVSSIARALRRLFSLTDSERETMGRSGQLLVRARYQWQQIGRSMTEVYDWVLGKGPKPSCVLD
jgi:glycosyltransferase involved in cell wall biosynthesis